MKNTFVVFHGDCLDGLAAGYAAYSFLREEATYIKGYYGAEPLDFPEGSFLYLVDFCYSREVLTRLAKKLKHIVIIDHHKTAEAALEGIQDEVENITVRFDMNHSAAILSWRYFRNTCPTPDLFYYLEDRDMWWFKLPGSKEVNESLFSYPMDFATMQTLLKRTIDSLESEGVALLRQKNQNVSLLTREPRAAYFGNYVVPCVNAPHFLGSDTCHALLQKYPDAPFAATYRDSGNGERYWSLRSEDSRVDVSEIAKKFRGGGHRNAAGFEQKQWQVQTVPFSFNQTYEEAIAESNGVVR